MSSRGKAQNAVSGARRNAPTYLDPQNDPAVRADAFERLLREEDKIKELPEKHRARIREEAQLMALVARAHMERASSKVS